MAEKPNAVRQLFDDKDKLNTYRKWTTEQLSDYLNGRGIEARIVQKIKDAGVDGNSLERLSTSEGLKKLGIDDAEDQRLVIARIEKLIQTSSLSREKIFNDPVHGHMHMHPVLVAIIDTPQLQRLRWIKQLGLGYLVYPGASHNRFEHSLGVAHLAGEFGRSLQRQQPERGITNVDILCLEIAGLCHDMGHGPFSHVFDNKFIPLAIPGKEWTHEDNSVKMFDHMVKKNKLLEKFREYGMNVDKKPYNDIKFIEELIRGVKDGAPFEGRPADKRFLYEIVANKRTEIDVDKWDYFARDCHHLGLKSTFDHHRFIAFARVIRPEDVGGQPMPPVICCRDKEAKNLYDMFQDRATLHYKAYQHNTTQNVENMIVQAMLKANEDKNFRIIGTDGKFTISGCIDNMDAYTRLTDNIFTDILFSLTKGDKLAEAREILERIQARDLYAYISETRLSDEYVESQEAAQQEAENALKQEAENASQQEAENASQQEAEDDSQQEAENALKQKAKNALQQKAKKEIAEICKTLEKEVVCGWDDEIITQLVKFDYGMGDEDPIKKMYFYSKYDPDTVFLQSQDEVSRMLPKTLVDRRLRLYCKTNNQDLNEIAGNALKTWCKKHGCSEPKTAIDFSPCKKEKPEPAFTTPEKKK